MSDRGGSTLALFAGQGAEAPGMGLALAETDAEARRWIELAGELAGVDALRVIATGAPALSRTEVLQPLLVAVQLGAVAAARRAGLVLDVALGHSLGELTAWAAVGALEPEDAIRIAARRGALMGAAARAHPGGMIAIDPATGDAALALGSTHGLVSVAAQNGPHELVLAGDEAALAAIARTFRATRLAASGAWHSPRMQGVIVPLADVLGRARWRAPRGSVVSTVSASVVRDAAHGRALLARQLVEPVRFADALRLAHARSERRLVCMGPARAIGALCRRLGVARPLVLETPADERAIAATMRALEEAS